MQRFMYGFGLHIHNSHAPYTVVSNLTMTGSVFCGFSDYFGTVLSTNHNMSIVFLFNFLTTILKPLGNKFFSAVLSLVSYCTVKVRSHWRTRFEEFCSPASNSWQNFRATDFHSYPHRAMNPDCVVNSLDIVLQDFFYLHSALRITRGPEKHGVLENTEIIPRSLKW